MEAMITEYKHTDLTIHCKQRYVERVKGITDSIEVQNYMTNNNDRIIQDVNKIFTYSTFLTETKIGGNNTVKRFYIKDDILLILRADESVIITLIKIDFGFPSKINRKIIKDLSQVIYEKREDLKNKENEIASYINSKIIERERVFDEIQLLQEKINALKSDLKEMDADIEGKRASIKIMRLELKKYVKMIYNSRDFKNDLKQISELE